MPTTHCKPSRACPEPFRAACHEALMGRDDYESAGHRLGRLVSTLAPDGMKAIDWEYEVQKLQSAIVDDDDRAEALAWLDRWLPRCMELVPARHRDEVLSGLDRAACEFDLCNP